MKDKGKQSTVISPEEAMNSYFGDLFSEGCSVVPDEVGLLSPALEFLPSASVESGYCLIPIINLSTRIVDFTKPQRSLVESFILLLWGGYLLRQPVYGKLRIYVHEYCNEMSMEYHLLLDLANKNQAGGEGK